MRIVSLLPSATEIVAMVGLADQLVAVSHECDYPPDAVAGKPRLTKSAIPKDLDPFEIDAQIAERIHSGKSLYLLDEKLLDKLSPDVIFTQELCDVCAVSYSAVKDAACRLSTDPRVVSLEPSSLGGILDNVRTVGKVAHVAERAEKLIASLQARLDRVGEKTRGVSHRPRVYAMEWLNPPYNAGHWVPEMVSLAGGIEVLGHLGKPSTRVTWDAIIASQPEYIFLMPCGHTLDQIVGTDGRSPLLEATPLPEAWWDLPAVRNGNVFGMDSTSYYSRPAPRVVDGVEILAGILHPEIFSAPSPSAARRIETMHVHVQERPDIGTSTPT